MGGLLAFGNAVFSTTPRLYEMTPEEAKTILSLCGDRVTLEPLEPESAPGKRRTMPTRGQAQGDAQDNSSRDGLTL